MATKPKGVPARPEAKKMPAPMGTFGFPGGLFAEMHDRMNRVFEDFWQDFPTVTASSLPALSPRVEVEEKDKAFLVTAELPGLDEGDIDISIAEDSLTIKGEKKTEAERDEKNVHVSERSYGSFRRSFRLPPEADADKITADFTKGVLSISVPKKSDKESPVKKVKIKKS